MQTSAPATTAAGNVDLGRPVLAPAPSRRNTVAWRSMPSVWWPWMCQLLAVEASDTSIDLELVALRRARVGGATVEAGTPFTVRMAAPAADNDLLTAWAQDAAVVMILAGRHERTAWVSLGVGDRRTLLEGASTTLVAAAAANTIA
jgi:hypothetical protein